jgi:uncharacterized protein (DUF885 family)
MQFQPRQSAAVLLLAAAASCGVRDAVMTEPQRVTSTADRYLSAYFSAFPHEATLIGAAGVPHNRLPDNTLHALARWHEREDAIYGQLSAIDAGAIPRGSAAAVTHGFLLAVLEGSRAHRVCHMELWNVSPTWTGWQSVMAALAAAQPVGTDAQNDAAYRRFALLPRYIDHEIENLREGLRRGYSAPRGNVRAVIRQLDALLGAPVAESPFVAMAPDGESVFRGALEVLEAESVRPAIRRYRDFLEQVYLPQARAAIGVSANPGGEECYRAAIRYHATVAVAPEEVHRIGLEQMALIRQEMAEIAQRMFGSPDVDAALERLRADPRYLFSSRDEMLAAARHAAERARLASPQWFARVPAAPVVVEPFPAFQEESAPGGFYNSPAEDGSRPGLYNINLHEAATKPRAGLEATAFHETYPGHHLQIALAMERRELHPVSRYLYLSGFGEGWALYAERLADEMGLYSADVDRMGLLSNEALRAARLVVDPGMHALGWSRERALDYMLRNTAESQASIAAEVDRYIAVPGQATSYMLGSLEIMRLREEARAAFGARFDIREFHDLILADGSVPLVMLRRKIENWIAESAPRRAAE